MSNSIGIFFTIGDWRCFLLLLNRDSRVFFGAILVRLCRKTDKIRKDFLLPLSLSLLLVPFIIWLSLPCFFYLSLDS